MRATTTCGAVLVLVSMVLGFAMARNDAGGGGQPCDPDRDAS